MMRDSNAYSVLQQTIVQAKVADSPNWTMLFRKVEDAFTNKELLYSEYEVLLDSLVISKNECEAYH